MRTIESRLDSLAMSMLTRDALERTGPHPRKGKFKVDSETAKEWIYLWEGGWPGTKIARWYQTYPLDVYRALQRNGITTHR